jgi:lipoate-protein ligase A
VRNEPKNKPEATSPAGPNRYVPGHLIVPLRLSSAFPTTPTRDNLVSPCTGRTEIPNTEHLTIATNPASSPDNDSFTGKPTTLAVLSDPPCTGPVNMGRDEALLTLVGRGEHPPTLRLYEWSPPTISLGYFQPYAEYQALPPPAGGLPIVRRLTGGGAILHDLELTYSLAVPLDHPLVAKDPNRLYEIMHQAVIRCLEQLGLEPAVCGHTDDSTPARGPFFCFARRHRFDVLLGVGKIAGSAQRRTRRAILQHGSIILDRRFNQQPSATIGSHADAEALRRSLPPALAAGAGLRWAHTTWTDAALKLADQFTEKYACDAWTQRR